MSNNKRQGITKRTVKKHQEQIKAGKRLEYLRNAEKYKERARIYKEEHREEINRKSRENTTNRKNNKI